MPHRSLIWILLAGAALRLALFFLWRDWSPLVNDDARDYASLAEQLVATGSYASASGELISLRPPLYPALVAAILSCFGVGNWAAVQLLQSAMSLLTVVLVYRLGSITFSRLVGLGAAAIMAFYPSLLAFNYFLLSEALFTFLSVLFALLVVEGIRSDRLLPLVLAGAVGGLAALTRSILMLFMPLLAIYLLMIWKGKLSRRLVAAAIPVAVFAIVITPWAVRNTKVQKTLTIIDVMGGRNAMMGNYEYTPLERSWATISDVTGERAWHQVLALDRKDSVPMTQGQWDKLALKHGMRFVIAHPWLTIQRDVIKFFNFWQLERTVAAAMRDGYFGNPSTFTKAWVAILTCGAYAVAILLGIVGMFCTKSVDSRFHWFLLGSILFPSLIHSLIFGHERYHLPVMPLVFIYASSAAFNAQQIWQNRRDWRLWLAAVCCVVLMLAWIREIVFVDLQLAGHLFG